MNLRRVLELVIGAYAGLVLVPASALWLRVSGWVTPTIGVLVGAAVGVATVVALLARLPDNLAHKLASLPVAVASVLPPIAYLPYMILATAPESPEAFIAVIGLLAILPGIAVPVGGAIVRNRRRRESATEAAVLTVGQEEANSDGRNWQVIAGAVVIGLSVVVFVVIVLVDGDVTRGAITPILGGFSMWLLFVDDDETEVAVTDEGLGIDRSFTAWEDLDGYRVTDGEIELVREEWYLPTRSFDRPEIGDEEALLAGLGRFLPRLDEHGRIEVTAQPR